MDENRKDVMCGIIIDQHRGSATQKTFDEIAVRKMLLIALEHNENLPEKVLELLERMTRQPSCFPVEAVSVEYDDTCVKIKWHGVIIYQRSGVAEYKSGMENQVLIDLLVNGVLKYADDMQTYSTEIWRERTKALTRKVFVRPTDNRFLKDSIIKATGFWKSEKIEN